MSIINKIIGNLSETVVYWATPVSDGLGGYTFDDPVELDARWEQATGIEKDNNGDEQVIKARCFLSQDVDEGGFLYLGELTDLDSTPVPSDVSGALRILSFVKIPRLGKTSQFVRVAYLHMSNNSTI
jgi:hypothetical protein